MVRSGERLDPGDLGGPTADKHSTGGVGDKVSLLLAPLAAACGLRVPMLSGRGLGHTGGTLDKLAAIRGYRLFPANDEFLRIVREIGCSIVGQTETIAPADRRMYALRDVTGTVDCVPLITASIMSKKLAAGPETIVIDLKTGNGAFMRDLASARELAQALLAVGRDHGRRMAVVYSDMNQPLGRAVGHALETVEALAALRPEGRATAPADLVRLTEELASAMLTTAGAISERAGALARVREVWENGEAFARAERWIAAQGGRIDAARADFGLEVAPLQRVVPVRREGFLAAVDTREIGLALADLRGARRRVEDELDLATGLEILAKVGDRLEAGRELIRVYAREATAAERVGARVAKAFTIAPEPVTPPPLILEAVTGAASSPDGHASGGAGSAT
jgi:pyrimidine-nucleoside phosphorylase